MVCYETYLLQGYVARVPYMPRLKSFGVPAEALLSLNKLQYLLCANENNFLLILWAYQ
jgi:hypothetical protein